MQEIISKNKVVFIIPFFGKLPPYYYAWKHTAIKNKTFDFLFITDINEITEENNIKVVRMRFDELRTHIQEKFSFPISLQQPYKLCDYKPAYGFIFQELIEHYSFWGHCDIDVILGNLKNFITDDILQCHDKIYEHGHMTLYRNVPEITNTFHNDGNYPEYNMTEVYQSTESHFFDEFYGMMLKSRRLNTTTYLNTLDFFDVVVSSLPFVGAHDQEQKEATFEWHNGSLFAVYSNGQNREIAYVHFQKRKIDYSTLVKSLNEISSFYIVPNKLQLTSDVQIPSSLAKKKYQSAAKLTHVKDFFKRYKTAKSDYQSIYQYYQSRQAFKARRKEANLLLKSHHYA